MSKLSQIQAYNLSHTWFKAEGQDELSSNRISFGTIIQLYVFEYFYNGANATRQRAGITGWIKSHHYEWHARFFHSLFRSSKNNPTDTTVLSVYDVNNAPMIENINLLSNFLLQKGIPTSGVVVDSAIARRVSPELNVFNWTDAYTFSKK